MQDEKKLWQNPEIIDLGTIHTLTEQVKLKTPGTVDDFMVPGIQNPTS